MSRFRVLLVVVLCLVTSTVVLADTNVALNKPATAVGSGFYSGPTSIVCAGTPEGVSAANDGVFHRETDCWLNGVAWNGKDNSIDIDLNGTFLIDAAIVQADDNDTYELQYRGIDNLYHDWWAIGAISSWGLVTRPNADQVTRQSLASVEATGLRIFATGGDELYAVSEVQVYGSPVPEPSSLMLLGSGLAAFAGTLRRKFSR